MPEEIKTKKLEVTVYSPDFMGPDVKDFLQRMFNRTGVSYFKYGPIDDNFPHRRSGVANALVRLKLYDETHNLEELIDAANYLLIEYLRPTFSDAHFTAGDSDTSPGALNNDGTVSHGRD